MSEQDTARRIHLGIEDGHDLFEIHTEDGEVFIVLTSRGTFRVRVNLLAADAIAFADALMRISAVAQADMDAARARHQPMLLSQESSNT